MGRAGHVSRRAPAALHRIAARWIMSRLHLGHVCGALKRLYSRRARRAAPRGKDRAREPCQAASRSLPSYRGQTSRGARRASYDRDVYTLYGGKYREPIRCAPRDTDFPPSPSAARRELRVCRVTVLCAPRAAGFPTSPLRLANHVSYSAPLDHHSRSLYGSGYARSIQFAEIAGSSRRVPADHGRYRFPHAQPATACPLFVMCAVATSCCPMG
jgi:hypothetical protein